MLNATTGNGHSNNEPSEPIGKGNALFVTRSAQPRPDEQASPGIWHLKLGHAGPEAIAHLSEAATGAKLIRGPSTIDCETCSVSKATRVISRRASPRGTHPYERVCWDLIQMSKAYNGDKWISHMRCDRTCMNHVYTQRSKKQSLPTMQRFVKWVYRRYGCVVKIIRLDGETSMLKGFEDWAAEEGITIERSSPYTPPQNGVAERSGGMIIQKSRCIAIGAQLPEELWPETGKTSGYLLNKSPTKQLEWRTPLEQLHRDLAIQNPQPNLSHLKVFGCRAYPVIPSAKIPKTRKLLPRAHIGYLVGYESTNIFRIWVPSEMKVIKTRDVTFNEELFYDPNEIDLPALLREHAEQIVEVVEFPPDSATLTEHLDLDSDVDIDDDDEAIPGEQAADQGHSIEPLDKNTDPTPGSSHPLMLPTPEHTPEPTGQLGLTSLPVATRAIIGDVSEANILDGPRTRKRSDRRAAYLADLERPQELPAYLAAFAAGIQHGQDQLQRLHRDQLPQAPRTWKEMLSHQFKDQFLAAATKEYTDLERRDTFRHVSKTSAITADILPLMWVFIYKFDTDGFLSKFKARICVRGDLQAPTQHDTYAATLAARTFRSIMAVAAAFDLEMFQFDAVNAFTNSAMDETVYCACPEGFQEPGKCWLLQRALYGLRTSPLLWLKEFSATLRALGLQQVDEEACLFRNDWLLVFFYVDDIAAICRTADLHKFHQFKTALMSKYEMRFMGELRWFLGIRVIRDRKQRKLWLCQDSYVAKIAKGFGLDHTKPAKVPMNPYEDYCPYTDKASPQQIHLYQRKVGSLLYAATITRPDIARSASKLSEFLQNPSPNHHAAADQVISFLYGTRTLAIEFSADSDEDVFTCASDAAFVDDKTTIRSTEGYLFKLFGGAVDWHSTKQKAVTTSTTEAELHALTHAAKEAYWWKRFFASIQLDPGHEFSLLCDNQQTVGLVTKDVMKLTTKLRHVDVNNHWLRQEVQAKRLQIHWIPTADMPADGLTKALPRQRHEIFLRQLGLTDIRARLDDCI